MAIMSIQSHVAYGYVGNRAAVFPLQMMGHDVWQVNTVQFSNHSGYGSWKGEIFSKNHIESVIEGIKNVANISDCNAILSGYLGSQEIGQVIQKTYNDFKLLSPDLIYLCDPVIGDIDRGVFVREEVLDFYKKHLNANIITPNHFEASILSGIQINNLKDASRSANYFHDKNIDIVIITSINASELDPNKIHIYLSDKKQQIIATGPLYKFDKPTTGTGDLFSSLFLGHYLKLKNSYLALKNAFNQMNNVMAITHLKNSRELRVIDLDYKQIPDNDEIKFIFV